MNYMVIELKDNWSLQMEGDSQIYQAMVPGTVQSDLLYNKRLPEPFYRENEKEYQWVDKENWLYTNSFQFDSLNHETSQIFLNFTGLDTYAEVYLNDNLILKADNFYRSWKIKVNSFLKDGENTLKIKFLSPIDMGLRKLEENGYPLPAVNDQSEVGGLGDKRVSVFTRKAPYHYGWDWGPRFVTMGIWRPVYLEFITDAEIQDVFIEQVELSETKASLNAHLGCAVYNEGTYKLEISNSQTGEVYASKTWDAEISENQIDLPFEIEDPQLWWPNGYGDQKLYEIKASLKKGNQKLQSTTHKIGLRNIKVVQNIDDQGKTFFFEVNGVPVFAKGTNYIPNDIFLPNVSEEKYRHIISSAVVANMNMIRVWGGGIYENDIFYELCDQYGLLVWQDFMFACSMYPGNDEFLENVNLEAVENVKRLCNHPSIALWCGNNEMDVAWCQWDENCGWGWKELYNEKQRNEIWQAYDTLFHQILPEVVKTYSPHTFYWPSSPMADYGKAAGYDTKSGDMHYWGVWHGGDPFEDFEKVIPRFMSEYGFQSFPESNTIHEFTLPQDWDIYSEVMLKHQRSPIGNQKIRDYMEMYYKVPDNFNDLLYVGQVLQGYGIAKAIDMHRINKPFCMGTLYWQLNDCWPGASWSSIDYYGNWKALHYKVREVFDKTRIAARQNEQEVALYVVNDDIALEHGVLQLNIYSFEGDNLYQENAQVDFSFDSSTLVSKLDLAVLTKDINLKASYLLADLYSEDELVNRTIHYFDLPKNLELPVNTLEYSIHEKSGSYVLHVKAMKLIKDLAIYIPGVKAHYSNNYFDLLPGEEKDIQINLSSKVNNVLEKGVVIHCLNNINNKY